MRTRVIDRPEVFSIKLHFDHLIAVHMKKQMHYGTIYIQVCRLDRNAGKSKRQTRLGAVKNRQGAVSVHLS